MNSLAAMSDPPSGLARAADAEPEQVACGHLQPVRELHRNAWFSVHDRGGYCTVEYHQQHVIVLPVVEGRAIVMVRVKRPLLNDTPLELPAGGCDPGEAARAGAARELAEETGIVVAAARLRPMPPQIISPNRTPQATHVFRVDLSQDEFERRGPHDDEIAGLVLLPFAQAKQQIACGGIRVAAAAAVIAAYLFSCETCETGAAKK